MMKKREKYTGEAPVEQKSVDRYRQLLKEKEQALALEPEKALDRILSAREPAALVHTFAEEDLYLLIHEIGAEDALPLMTLASDRQLDFIFDMETWIRDRIEINSLTKWLNLLLKADPKRFFGNFIDEKIEYLEFYMNQTVQVIIREHDQDPSDFGPEFFTFDDTFYVRIIDDPIKPPAGSREKKQREDFLSSFLQHLSEADHVKYQQMLMESARVIPAEVEEEAFRLRNVRLAEKGFLPFDEAVGVYQFLKPADLYRKDAKILNPADQGKNSLQLVPVSYSEIFSGAGLFSAALKTINEIEVLHQLQAEFAGLCNRIIAADQKKVRERSDLSDVVKKACGYIGIGLEQLTRAGSRHAGETTAEAAALIAKYPLPDIFRVGFGQALTLKWRAQNWRKQSWFARQGLTLGFWGEKWLGALGGLLVKKPLYFDNYQTGALYRDFWSPEDIEATGSILQQIMAFDGLLSAMGLTIDPNQYSPMFNCRTLVLTVWARESLRLSPAVEAIHLDRFIPFFDSLWDPSRPGKIQPAIKESFLKWAAGASGQTVDDVTQELRNAFEDLFNELEDEYRQVSAKDLAPQYMTHFLISK